MPAIEVCLTPDLLHLHPTGGKTVVVTDILRATSCIVAALGNGVVHVKPVATVRECKELQGQGYLAAAERNGQQVEGFDLGNSPLSYVESDHSGRKLAMTTTNGTLAIKKSLEAKSILIGAFLNLSSLVHYLEMQTDDLLIVCAGWKGKVSFEDTLFAGALVSRLAPGYNGDCDGARLSCEQYECNRKTLLEALRKSSHYKRLRKLNVGRDLAFCATLDLYDIVPVLQHDILVAQ